MIPTPIHEREVRRTASRNLYRKVNELLGQDYLSKPAPTLAGEGKAMLDGLAAGCCNKTLESVYKGWLDSPSYRGSFNGYLGSYKLSSDLISGMSVSTFRQVDELWLVEIGKNLSQ